MILRGRRSSLTSFDWYVGLLFLILWVIGVVICACAISSNGDGKSSGEPAPVEVEQAPVKESDR